jgi:hypothetical protein
MGKILLIALAAMIFAGGAGAQLLNPDNAYIGLFADVDRTRCEVGGSGNFNFYYYVFAKPSSEGIFAVEFSVWYSEIVYERGSMTLNPEINLTLGEIETGWAATFADCQTDWVQVFRQRVFCNADNVPDGAILLGPSQVSQFMGVATCDLTDEWFTFMNQLFINGPCTPGELLEPFGLQGIQVVDSQTLEVWFSAAADSAGAVNRENYEIIETNNPSDTLQILAISRTEPWMVRLILGNPIEPGISYRIRVRNVYDHAGNPIQHGTVTCVLVPGIVHEPITCGTPGADLLVRWSFCCNAITRVSNTCLTYRPVGSTSWISLCANNPRNEIVMAVPGTEMREGGIEYYITATTETETSITVYNGSADAPHVVPACQDTSPPWIEHLQAVAGQALEVRFNEPLDSLTAVDGAHYTLFETENRSDTAQVVGVALRDARTVRVTLGAPFKAAVSYTIIVSGVRDKAGNPTHNATYACVLIPLVIVHSPVTCGVTGRDVAESWTVSDPTFAVARTCLYYRRTGSTPWVGLCEDNPINPVVMTIPGDSMGIAGVEYYITATNGIGATAYHGSAGAPHYLPACPPAACERPIVLLQGYRSIEYTSPIWRVSVEVYNGGPGIAKNVVATMNADVSWLTIPDPLCHYGNIEEGTSSLGDADSYSFDLTGNPGGSFNVWFDVTYDDSCGNSYRVRLDPAFGIDGDNAGTSTVITAYRLGQNYPNPFNPITTIDYQLPVGSRVSLKIFDVSGKLIRTLVDDDKGAGAHTALWDGKDALGKAVASSIYFYELRAGNYRETKRMVLLR